MRATDSALLEQAQAWIAQDPDPATREELRKLIDANDLAAIGDRFSGRLAYFCVEVREITLRSPICARPVRIWSWMPSAK